MIPTDHEFFTHAEAAGIARCHTNTLHNWDPPCRERRGKKWLYPREEFLAWLRGGGPGTPSKERIDPPPVKPQNRTSLYRKMGASWRQK